MATNRVEALYKPYHSALRRLVDQAHAAFGFAILIDCHSMPSSSFSKDEPARADIVLGDRYGTSCSGLITEALEGELRARGLSILRNKPYAGGFITEHYGRPARDRHAIQIEINRALYMDERTLTPTSGFAPLAAALAELDEDFRRIALVLLAGGRLRGSNSRPIPAPTAKEKGRPFARAAKCREETPKEGSNTNRVALQ